MILEYRNESLACRGEGYKLNIWGLGIEGVVFGA